MVMTANVVALFRPASPDEIVRMMQRYWRAFMLPAPSQAYFYPFRSHELACLLAEGWYARRYGSGFVVRAWVQADFLARFDCFSLGGADYLEYRIPVAQMDEFNRNIVGNIELLGGYGA